MDLLDLTKDLFSFLVLFREKVGSAASPTLEEVRRDLDGIFRKMEEETRKRPSLAAPYLQVKYALAAFADEVVLSSGWDQSSGWEAQLLELELFGTNVAGDRFFELMSSLDGAPRQVVSVYFRCLALGFSGRYQPGSKELEQAKRDLLARLKIPSPEYAGRLAPEGYEGVMMERTRLGRLMSWRFGLLLVLGVALGLFLFDRFVLWPWLTRDASQVADLAEARLKESALESLAALKADKKDRKDRQHKSSAGAAAQKTKSPSVSGFVGSKPAGVGEPSHKPAAKSEARPPRAKASAPEPGGGQPTPEQELWEKGYLVQVGSFVGAESAERMADRLAEAGLPSWTANMPRGEGKVWHVVLVGPYRKFTQAQQIKTRLSDKLNLMPVIVDALEYKARTAHEAGRKAEPTPPARPDKTEPAKKPGLPPAPLYREKLVDRAKKPAPKAAPAGPPAKNGQPGWQVSVGDEKKDAAQVASLEWKKGFLVQLGAFVGPNDTKRLAGRVAGSGYDVWVVDKPRPGARTWYLVVCGPFSQYQEAKSALAVLEREYALKPIIVDAKDYAGDRRRMVSKTGPAKKAPPPVSGKADAKELWSRGFLVQVGVFIGPKDAANLVERLGRAGFEAMVIDRPRSQGKVWHVVMVGPFADSPRAGEVQREIEKKIGLRPIVVDAREFAGSRR